MIGKRGVSSDDSPAFSVSSANVLVQGPLGRRSEENEAEVSSFCKSNGRIEAVGLSLSAKTSIQRRSLVQTEDSTDVVMVTGGRTTPECVF